LGQYAFRKTKELMGKIVSEFSSFQQRQVTEKGKADKKARKPWF